MGKRVIVLGTTGVDKKSAIANLLSCHQDVVDSPSPRVVDFEEDYVKPQVNSLYDYLDAREERQRDIWRAGWSVLRRDLQDSLQTDDILLSMHGILVRSLYGGRSPLSFDDLRWFRPTHVVTLIDDVYSCWQRTEARAHGLDWRGRPTLDELVSARRFEVLIGDLLAANCGPTPTPRNYVLAVKHPARTLQRLIFGPKNLLRVYLSFPISGPRELAARGDVSGLDEVNSILSRAADFEAQRSKLACFCPLSIDELPLRRAIENSQASTGAAEFNMAWRWDVRRFWGPHVKLLANDDIPARILLERDQIEDVFGLIGCDVKTRDYRLVIQSRAVAVFNPWFNGRMARGVDNEIACARFHTLPVYVFQDPRHDPQGNARRELRPPAGSLGIKPFHEYISFHDSVEALMEAIIETA